jgi:hypothetical protein
MMGAPRRLSALGVLGLLAIATACGNSGSTTARHSPSASPTGSLQPTLSPSPSGPPAPRPVVGGFGVLVTTITGSDPYTVALIGIDGKVAASAQATSPVLVSCANAAGAPVPLPVSSSNTRVYFMDAAGAVRFLGPGGDTGQATTVPAGTGTRRSMFAVSPDDQRIAVIVNDYTASGAATRLYIEDLNGGGNHIELFTENGAKTLWPVGWHGTNNLVLAVVPSCTQGGAPFCCGIQELHVVDPATATRRYTLGNVASCPIVGSASSSGVICWDGSQSKVINWTGATVRTYPVKGPELQYLSPNGSRIALVDNIGTTLQGTSNSFAGLFACAWIDDEHLLAGGDSQHQARIGDATNGAVTPVPAQGDCGGRVPGGL